MKLARIMVIALALTLLAASTSFGAVIAFRTGTLNEIAVNAQTGLVGNIGLVPLVDGSIPAGEIVNFTFTAPISSTTDLKIRINGVEYAWNTVSAGFAISPSATPVVAALISNAVVTVDAAHIAIAFNADVAATAGTAIIEIDGVRVNATPTGAPSDRISATITSARGQVAVTDPDVEVAVLREPLTVTVDATSIVSNLETIGGTASANVKITELFTNAFETKGGTGQTRIKLALTVPSTLTFTGASLNSSALTGTDGALLTYSFTNAAATTTNPLFINIDTQDPNALETIVVTLAFKSAVNPVPLNPGSISVQATLDPPTTTFPVTVNTTNRLRFAERLRPSPAATIDFSVTPLTSRLLSLFNVAMAPNAAIGFAGLETGIAVQNASPILDRANPGVIKVSLYKADGSTPVTFTTSATKRPGSGLNADGQLVAGGTWAVLLSQLLTTAGVSGDWEGMIVFDCDFSAGTGVNYVSDFLFATQAQGYQMVDTRQWVNLTTLSSPK